MKACWSRRYSLLSALILAALGASSARAADDVLIKALNDELQRSMQKLQLGDLEKPYFVAYTVQDAKYQSVSATFGSLVSKTESRYRLLTVEVRVGDYAFDNTNFLSMPFGSTGVTRLFGGTITIPRDDVFVATAALHHDVSLYSCDPHFALIRDKGHIPLHLL